MVDPEWSFKAFYIGPVPGHPRLVFVAAVSLFNYLPEGLKPRRTIDLVENEFACEITFRREKRNDFTTSL